MPLNGADFYKDKQVLVTGGAGFIGSHLVEALVAGGARVRVIDDLSAGRLDNLADSIANVEFRQLDITKADDLMGTLDGMDVVFHLAANASVPKSVENPRYDFCCNALGTLNILSALRRSSVQNCVLASSGAVYGEPAKFPIEESHPLIPISPYGASKVSCEALAHAFHASYGVPVTIARIFNTYGARQPRFVMYDFYRKLAVDPARLEILGNGKQIRDFCYVADTVSALMHVGIRAGDGCEAFNVSSGSSYSVVEVARSMFDVMGLDDVQVVLSGKSWAGDAQRWEVSIEKIMQHTMYRPAYDLKSGLARFIRWFGEHPERLK
jgi:UDP-glucose 4-epimerase